MTVYSFELSMNYNHVILFFVHLLTPTTSHVCEDTVGQIFPPAPADCSQYYLCTPQRAWTLNCPHGTAWNQISSKCEDKAWNVLCNKQGKLVMKQNYYVQFITLFPICRILKMILIQRYFSSIFCMCLNRIK